MENEAPRRRGRPPTNPAHAQASDVAAAETTTTPPARRRRTTVGQAALKLAAPARPGFVRRWFNDDNNRIATAHELAYEHVTDQGVQSSSSDTRISRLVGTKANGEPLRAFLMETPEAEYAAGNAEREAHNRLVDEAISAGRDSTGQMTQTETYGRGSIQRDR